LGTPQTLPEVAPWTRCLATRAEVGPMERMGGSRTAPTRGSGSHVAWGSGGHAEGSKPAARRSRFSLHGMPRARKQAMANTLKLLWRYLWAGPNTMLGPGRSGGFCLPPHSRPRYTPLQVESRLRQLVPYPPWLLRHHPRPPRTGDQSSLTPNHGSRDGPRPAVREVGPSLCTGLPDWNGDRPSPGERPLFGQLLRIGGPPPRWLFYTSGACGIIGSLNKRFL